MVKGGNVNQLKPLNQDEEFLTQLEDSAKILVEKLQANSYQEASEVIHTLVEARNNHIFNAVGQLTRGLHEAIVNFNVDETCDKGMNESEIQDASNRLNYVIKTTQAAADRTMDKVEAIAPLAENLGLEADTLKSEWVKLKRRELNKDDFKELYDRVDDFLSKMQQGTSTLNHNFQEIILEQGFQDLTGQVLRKVIGLITDVERDLVNLMRIAGQVEQVTGMAAPEVEKNKRKENEGEGPQINAENRQDVVNNQDDVDDLLSSLGF